MFQIKLTPTAANSFSHFHPELKKKQLKKALRTLKDDPYAGKTLREKLFLFRSFKIKRYRVIYQIDDNLCYVIITAIGHRRDIYEVAAKLLKRSI